jgi:predicted NBD/HSP70 family sugar kinase
VVNDIEAARAEAMIGEDAANATVAVLVVGTGIGAAFWASGRALGGARGWAGEVSASSHRLPCLAMRCARSPAIGRPSAVPDNRGKRQPAVTSLWRCCAHRAKAAAGPWARARTERRAVGTYDDAAGGRAVLDRAGCAAGELARLLAAGDGEAARVVAEAGTAFGHCLASVVVRSCPLAPLSQSLVRL